MRNDVILKVMKTSSLKLDPLKVFFLEDSMVESWLVYLVDQSDVSC